jgi:hypothetical protein
MTRNEPEADALKDSLPEMNSTLRKRALFPPEVKKLIRPPKYEDTSTPKDRPWHFDPTIYKDEKAAIVKLNTGFQDMFALLRFVMIVCNGDISVATKNVTSMNGSRSGTCILNGHGVDH